VTVWVGEIGKVAEYPTSSQALVGPWWRCGGGSGVILW
jgi:hypothetical protein